MEGAGQVPGTTPEAGERPRSTSGAELAAALSMANVGFYVASIGVVLVVLADDLGVPAERLSWLGSAFGYGLLVMALAGPMLLSRLGQRWVLTATALVMASGSVLLSLVPGEWSAYAGALLQGLGAAGMVLVAPRLLHGPDATVALTRVNGVASAVAISAPLLLGLASYAGIGTRLPLLLLAGAAVALVWVARRVVDEPVETGTSQAAGRSERGTAVRRWLTLVCAVSAEFAFVVFGVARLVATGLSAGDAAILATGFQVGMAVGRLVGPRLIGRVPMVLVGALLAGAGTLLVVLAGSWPLVALGQLLAGVGIATLYPITLARLMATPGLRPELGASLGALASATAIIVAPSLLAALALVVDLRVAFLVPLPVLGLLLWLYHERRPAVG